MLRRKMLMLLASLVGLLLLVAILAIVLLQGVLSDLNHTGVQDAAVADVSNQMGVTITEIEIELREIQLGRTHHLDALIERVEQLRAQTAQFGADYQRPLPQSGPLYKQLCASLDTFEEHIGMLATAQDQNLARPHLDAAITASVDLRQEILSVGKLMREHIAQEEEAAVTRFRWVVLGLALVFLAVINISVMVLLRMTSMVLRPVEQLVEASRRLAQEQFDYRVHVPQKDEFGELAAAYNQLAEQLQSNERRKLETLAQAAIMLNHELNNASAIIKLQLQLLERQSGGEPGFERCLRQINESLSRMTATLEALKHVRRIVLTDYSPDTKMLDLQRSVAEDPVVETPP